MRTDENIPALSAIQLAYNVTMLAALCCLGPIAIPWWMHQEKRRRTFLQRLRMQPIPQRGERCRRDARSQRIWVHALSVGEVMSAEPLVQALAGQVGREKLVFTASTHTGFQTAERVIAPHVGALRHFPYDTLYSVNRALDVIRPRRVVIVETDIWPNFLIALKARGIPAYLVNARLSDRSYRGYRRLAAVMGPLLAIFHRICVQTDTDRRRFINVGGDARHLITVGNIKFDQPPLDVPPDDARRLAQHLRLPPDRPVWVAGSTHAGEEELLADAYGQIDADGITPAMIIVPRDPSRAVDVCRRLNRRGLAAVTLSAATHGTEPRPFVVIDRIGLLRQLYTLADITFVGGSLVQAGGHNPLEPASAAKPILFGPHTDDFRWICRTLEANGGAVRVDGADAVAREVAALMRNRNRREAMGRKARRVFDRHRGAVQRTMQVIADLDSMGADGS